MTVDTAIQKYVDAWKDVLSFARSPLVWVPFALLGVLKMALLVLFYFCWKPAFSGFMVPAIRGTFGERAVHFPMHVLELAQMHGAAVMILMAALGFVLIGWAASIMVDRLEGNSVHASRYIAPTLFFVPALLLVGFVFAAGVQGLPALISGASAAAENQRLKMLLPLVGVGTGLLVKGILMYWPAYLVLSRGRVLAALEKSWRRARSSPWLTGVVVVTSWAPQAPIDYAVSRTSSLMSVAGPDAVFGVLAAGVILDTLGLFYLFGAAASIAVGKGEGK